MLDLLFLPFRLVWTVISTVFSILGGLFSLVFGLLGGIVEIAMTLAVIVLIVGVIRLARDRRSERHAQEEHFTSFYDQDGRVE